MDFIASLISVPFIAIMLVDILSLHNDIRVCHFNCVCLVIFSGNREGRIYVWELQSCPPVLIAKYVFSSFSFGNVLCDLVMMKMSP